MGSPAAEQIVPDTTDRPTRVRYLVVGLTMLAAVLLYLDRFCIPIAARYIKEDLGLSNEQLSLVFGAFFLTYALGQVPSGFLSDRYGSRRMLTLYILLWSAFTGLTGLATGFGILLALRFGFGLAQAGAYPTSAGLVSHWIPGSARATASALIAVGGRIGAFLAPLLTALLIVQFVPLSVPSLLTPDDLLDYPQFCHGLVNGPADLGRRLLAGLPVELRADVRREAARYEDALRRHRAGDLAAPAPARREALVRRLNDLLRDPNLARQAKLSESTLPAEARALLGRPAAELSPEELERLNRLVLETAYPEAIKKVYVAGWRPAMLTFGLAGLAVAGLFWFLTRDRPAQHPRCNDAEVRLIRPEGAPEAGSAPHTARRVPLGPMVRSASMWMMCLSQFGTNIGWVFLVTWLPRYLEQVHHLPLEKLGLMASLPLLVGWMGMLSGGWATDLLTRAVGPRWGCSLPMALSRFVAVGAYAVCLLNPGPWVATLAFSVVAFATDFGSPAMWAFSMDVGGRHVGSVLGWGNMWGNLGAAVAPTLAVWVLGDDRWWAVFLMCAVAFLVSGLSALGVNAAQPLEPEAEDRG